MVRALKRIRGARGLSQSALSRLSGVPQPDISNYETGKRQDLLLSTAIKLANALGVSAKDLGGVSIAKRGARRRARRA